MPQKLLIVDDDPDVRQSLRCALEELYDVVEAASGPEALRMIRDEHPRALLLDFAMPDMDGLEVLKAARELCPALAIVMLTGEMSLEVARQALECGARSYVTKPLDAEILRAEIRRMLEPPEEEGGIERPWRVAGE